MGGMCGKCTKVSGLLLLIVGVLFLLKDIGVWSFWGLEWYTVLFILIGIATMASSGCPDCQACCSTKGGEAPAAKGGRKR